MEKSLEWCAFMESYRTFVTQEVAPLCGDPTVGGGACGGTREWASKPLSPNPLTC
jgi:hypothetical protein